MNNEQHNQLVEIENALTKDDPALAHRFRRLGRTEARRDCFVFSLWVASVVLLAYGLSMQSAAAWFAGGAAFMASIMVDGHHERRVVRAAIHERSGSCQQTSSSDRLPN